MNKARLFSTVAICLMALTFNAGADDIWNETNDGPLSTDPLAPTAVTLVSPSDLVVGDGSMGAKYFTFNVPTGETVSSIVVDPGMGGIMTADVWMFSATASGTANCGQYQVLAPTELLDGSNCAPSLTAGDHTIGLNVVTSTPWTVTIASTVPVELQSFTTE